mmetsp:Transcript_16649/g.44739  ORF Transcript_16649/g.44739 Transcript_16649/m.44739 type:complete len:152 (-) Transcript_16649:862-1317(-)
MWASVRCSGPLCSVYYCLIEIPGMSTQNHAPPQRSNESLNCRSCWLPRSFIFSTWRAQESISPRFLINTLKRIRSAVLAEYIIDVELYGLVQDEQRSGRMLLSLELETLFRLAADISERPKEMEAYKQRFKELGPLGFQADLLLYTLRSAR